MIGLSGSCACARSGFELSWWAWGEENVTHLFPLSSSAFWVFSFCLFPPAPRPATGKIRCGTGSSSYLGSRPMWASLSTRATSRWTQGRGGLCSTGWLRPLRGVGQHPGRLSCGWMVGQGALLWPMGPQRRWVPLGCARMERLSIWTRMHGMQVKSCNHSLNSILFHLCWINDWIYDSHLGFCHVSFDCRGEFAFPGFTSWGWFLLLKYLIWSPKCWWQENRSLSLSLSLSLFLSFSKYLSSKFLYLWYSQQKTPTNFSSIGFRGSLNTNTGLSTLPEKAMQVNFSLSKHHFHLLKTTQLKLMPCFQVITFLSCLKSSSNATRGWRILPSISKVS